MLNFRYTLPMGCYARASSLTRCSGLYSKVRVTFLILVHAVPIFSVTLMIALVAASVNHRARRFAPGSSETLLSQLVEPRCSANLCRSEWSAPPTASITALRKKILQFRSY